MMPKDKGLLLVYKASFVIADHKRKLESVLQGIEKKSSHLYVLLFSLLWLIIWLYTCKCWLRLLVLHNLRFANLQYTLDKILLVAIPCFWAFEALKMCCLLSWSKLFSLYANERQYWSLLSIFSLSCCTWLLIIQKTYWFDSFLVAPCSQYSLVLENCPNHVWACHGLSASIWICLQATKAYIASALIGPFVAVDETSTPVSICMIKTIQVQFKFNSSSEMILLSHRL